MLRSQNSLVLFNFICSFSLTSRVYFNNNKKTMSFPFVCIAINKKLAVLFIDFWGFFVNTRLRSCSLLEGSRVTRLNVWFYQIPGKVFQCRLAENGGVTLSGRATERYVELANLIHSTCVNSIVRPTNCRFFATCQSRSDYVRWQIHS